MNISLEEFNPYIDAVILNGQSFQTRAFDLSAEVWAAKHFGSLASYIEKLKAGDPAAIYAAFYTLLETKEYNYGAFVRHFVLKGKEKPREVAQKIIDHLSQLVLDAQPLVKNPKRMKEISEALGRGELPNAYNYAVYFDRVAKRYGYTVKDFYSLTSRQLHAIFKAMQVTDREELEVKAALHGKQLKDKIHYYDISPEEEKAHEEQAYDALERLRKRAKEMSNGRN